MLTFAVTSVISIDHITLHNAPERVTVGSCGFYTALALARLGANVLFAGVHGNDFDSHRLDILREANATIQTCQLAGKTARLDLLYNDHGNIASAHYDEGISATVTADDLPSRFWDTSAIWIGTSPFDFQREVARRAAPYQAVLLSPQGEWKGLAQEVLTIAPYLSYLMINQRELSDLGFGGLRHSITALTTANPHLNFVITRSKQGAWLLTPDSLYSVPSAPNPVIADTTGAGDTFNAAFALQTLNGAAPTQALQQATAAAALSMRAYAYYNLPTSAEMQTYAATIQEQLPVQHFPRLDGQLPDDTMLD